MATPTSYLQTLSPTEASAFTASLQKVQAHLQQELAWMNQQVQQKTMQLQGIETLLTQASTLGLLETDAGTIAAPGSSDVQTTVKPSTEPETAAAAAPTESESAVANDTEAIADTSAAVPAPDSDSPPEPTAAPKAAQPEPTVSKPSTKAKSGKSSSGKTTAQKKPSTKSKSRPKASKTKSQPKSRGLLRPEFEDISLGDAVAQVLAQATEPVHLDQLVNEMYGQVSGEDLKRIKASLANVLSKGKRAGKWQNVGNGLYQMKTSPT